MKKFILLPSLIVFMISSLHAQSDVPFQRKGKFIIETNYSFLSTVLGGSSGFGFVSGGGSSLLNIGVDFGKFTGNNFALKGSFGILNSEGSSITTFSLGFKGYIGGSFIINPSGGIITDGDNVGILFGLHLGFAIKLANNIYLEPAFGARGDGDGILFEIRTPFMMLF